MNRAQDGDTVTVIFQGLLEDGRIFDASDESQPLTFVLGANEVVPGFEHAILGMEVHEQKTVTIPPEEGYGIRQSRLVEKVAIDTLPDSLDLRVGNQLEVTAANGTRFRLLVIERGTASVTLDANHPLAGQSLTFHIELLAIQRPTIN